MNTFAAGPRGRCTKTWVVAGLSAGTIELTNRCFAEGGPAAFIWRGALDAGGSHTPTIPGSTPGPATTFRGPVIRPTYLHARGKGREGRTPLDVDRHAPGDSREETGTYFQCESSAEKQASPRSNITAQSRAARPTPLSGGMVARISMVLAPNFGSEPNLLLGE